MTSGLKRAFASTALLCVLFLTPRSTLAQIPVVPDWSADEGAGTGFFDASSSPVAGYGSIGELRRAVFVAAANYVGSLFTPAYSGEEIQVKATFSDLGVGFIAYGGPLVYANNFGGSNPLYQPDTDYVGALANHLAGQVVSPGNTIEVYFNANNSVAFDYSTNNTPPPSSGKESLFVTMVHEMIHGLGFVNDINEFTGEYSGYPTIFDRFLVQGNITPVALTAMSDGSRLTAIKSSNLYWNGPAAMASNGGSRVKLFAPPTYQAATSVNHLDSSQFNASGLLMLPVGSPQVPSQLALVGLERAMLYEMGWTPARPRIVSIQRTSGTTKVQFTGILNANYRFRYSETLTGSVNGWSILDPITKAGWVGGMLMHDTTTQTGFYSVEASP